MPLYNEFTASRLITDGKFIYSCSFCRILNKEEKVEIVICGIYFIGVISKQEKITLPEHFGNIKIDYESLHYYKKEKSYPKQIENMIPLSAVTDRAWSIPDCDKYYLVNCDDIKKTDMYFAKQYIVPKRVKLKPEFFCNNKTVESIQFDETPTCIPYDCFNNCSFLTDVKLPLKLKQIASGAFFGCKNLKNINLPDKVIRIAESAFENTGLEYIIIPRNVKSINAKTFKDCKNLKFAVLGSNTEKIAYDAFKNCHNLSAVFISPKTEKISKRAFDYCNNLVIYSTRSSFAHEYAYTQNIPFVPIDSCHYELFLAHDLLHN